MPFSFSFSLAGVKRLIKGPAKDKEKERERHREGLVVNSRLQRSFKPAVDNQTKGTPLLLVETACDCGVDRKPEPHVVECMLIVCLSLPVSSGGYLLTFPFLSHPPRRDQAIDRQPIIGSTY